MLSTLLFTVGNVICMLSKYPKTLPLQKDQDRLMIVISNPEVDEPYKNNFPKSLLNNLHGGGGGGQESGKIVVDVNSEWFLTGISYICLVIVYFNSKIIHAMSNVYVSISNGFTYIL